jgi:hypothetical protein
MSHNHTLHLSQEFLVCTEYMSRGEKPCPTEYRSC